MKTQLPTAAIKRAFLRADLRGKKQGETGFTLIELLVVMIIIAILMAVAVPIFLSTKQKATASKAKQQAVNVEKAIKACAASNPNGHYFDNSSGGHNCFQEAYWNDNDKGMLKLLDPNCYAPQSLAIPSPTACIGGLANAAGEVTMPDYIPMPASYEKTSQMFLYSLSDAPDAPVAYITNFDNGERWCIRQITGDVNHKKMKQMCPVWQGEHLAVGKW